MEHLIMTQYDETVERQRLMLEAEAWSMGTKAIHVHGFDSMWYDNHPEDTEGSKMVTDVEYNCGLIERNQNGKLIRTFGKKLEGEELLNHYIRNI